MKDIDRIKELRATNNLERRFVSIEEFRIVDSEKGIIEGYPAVFNKWSDDLEGFIERIVPGAFKWALRHNDTVALFNHNADKPLGRKSAGNLRLKEDDVGLFMSLDPTDTSYSRDLKENMRKKVITKMSFAFRVRKDGDEWVEQENGLYERTLSDVELLDVSPVTYPAYIDTTVALRSLEQYRDNNPGPDAQGSEGNDADEVQGHEFAFRERDLELTKLDMEDSING